MEALITDRLQQDGWEVTRSLIADVMKTQAAVVHEQIGKGESVALGRLGVKINVRYKPKQPKRTGVFFGEERTVAARPASVVLKATFMKVAKDALPAGRKIAAIFGTGEPVKAAPKPKAAPKASPAKTTPKPAARRGARSKPDATKKARKTQR
jgi:hypothetical protein